MNSVPPWAASNRPTRSAAAPVKAPLAFPNISLSISDSGTAAMFMVIIVLRRRELCWWMARATSSFPEPDSPTTSTVLFAPGRLLDLPENLVHPRRLAQDAAEFDGIRRIENIS